VSPEGTFTIETQQSTAFEGTLNAATKQLNGTVQLPNRLAAGLLGITIDSNRSNRMINLSSRTRVGEVGGNALISGFVVDGSKPKQMLLRAIGPGLGSFGVQNALRNPRLQLFDNTGMVIAQNDDWGNSTDVSTIGNRVGAFSLTTDSLDSALLTTINPGTYTVQVSSGGGDGIVLVEVYDASEESQETGFANLSTRAFIDASESALISGFVVSGNTPKRVLIRGVGPTLDAVGVAGGLANPALQIFQGPNLVAQNDNWEVPQPVTESQIAASSAEISAAAAHVGAFPTRSGSLDAAIVIILAPGAYTAAVSGNEKTSGAALLEIYQLSMD
jgi:hypothetical protein